MSDGTTNLMTGVKPSAVALAPPEREQTEVFGWQYWTFANALLRQCAEADEGKNILLSPLSAAATLSMTANGAQGDTLSQMRGALGSSLTWNSVKPLDSDGWNQCFAAYLRSLPDSKKARLSSANAIWLKEGALDVKKDFLQANADYYSADVFSARFDEATKDDINGWVSDRTDGMIPAMLDEIPANAVMYLLNALAFDAEWKEIYRADQVTEGAFTGSNGKTATVPMMISEEGGYFEDGMATGFSKPYADGYRFVAILPNEGVTVQEYLASDNAVYQCYPHIKQMQAEDGGDIAIAGLPKFEADYSAELSGALKAMGMTDAFDTEKADFSGMADVKQGELYINRVLHKTAIRVDERGTKAGAATAVEMMTKGALMHSVILDRPFLYMIVDDEQNLPVFIGIVNHIE